MRRLAALFVIALTLRGCSYSYPIWATMVDGRLAFESGDRNYDCFTNIHVAAAGPLDSDSAILAIEDPVERGRAIDRARTAWQTDAVATYECKGHFPVVYGAAMPGITVVPARPLRVGVPYSVSTYGPRGAGGDGCFRINPDGRPENLPDQDCAYIDPIPPSAQPAAPGPPVVPAHPRSDLASLIGPEDYPASALRFGEEGSLRVALDVGVDGRVSGCTILRSSGSSALDGATCRILRSRARFTPARDSTGSPAPSRFEQEIAWTLPDEARSASRAAPALKPGQPGGMMTNSSSPRAVVVTDLPAPVQQPIDARPPPDRTGPSQMYALTPYRGIERYIRDYPSLAACEQARERMTAEGAARRLCGFGPRRP